MLCWRSVQVVMGMPPVQKAALAMLPKLAPTHLPQVCLFMLWWIWAGHGFF